MMKYNEGIDPIVCFNKEEKDVLHLLFSSFNKEYRVYDILSKSFVDPKMELIFMISNSDWIQAMLDSDFFSKRFTSYIEEFPKLIENENKINDIILKKLLNLYC